MTNKHHIFAYGLGLMLFSRRAVEELIEGNDYMPAGEALREPLLTRLAEQRVVFLGTGSPQLDYALEVHRGGPDDGRHACEEVSFALHIDEELVVRDGYAPMEWLIDDAGEVRVTVPSAYYRVTARWIVEQDDDAEGPMRIAFHLEPAGDHLSGDGWPYLPYAVR